MEDRVQASIVAVGGDRRMPVLGIWEGTRLRSAYGVTFKERRTGIVACLMLLFNCCLEAGKVPRTGVEHALFCSTKERGQIRVQ